MRFRLVLGIALLCAMTAAAPAQDFTSSRSTSSLDGYVVTAGEILRLGAKVIDLDGTNAYADVDLVLPADIPDFKFSEDGFWILSGTTLDVQLRSQKGRVLSLRFWANLPELKKVNPSYKSGVDAFRQKPNWIDSDATHYWNVMIIEIVPGRLDGFQVWWVLPEK